MGKRPSLKKQVRDRINEMFCPGRPKHQDKTANKGKPDPEVIYSYRTRDLYTDVGVRYTRWCKDQYGSRDLADCRMHVPEYLQMRRDCVAASTVHTDAAALAKLYGCRAADFGVDLPRRERGGFVKNRGDAWAGHYSKDLHQDIHILSEGSGVRRSEMARLTPDHVVIREDGRVWIEGVKGKGGKIRDILVRREYGDRILAMAAEARSAGRSTLLSGPIPARAPIHADRGQAYAQGLYAEFARPVDQIPAQDQYRCRKDLQGRVYDKRAMLIVTRSLGHSRLNVITNYFR